MSSGHILAFDVGGTSVKAGIVTGDLCVVKGSFRTYRIDSRTPADELVEAFCAIVVEQYDRWSGVKKAILGLALAFPGPFDYLQGISWMRGLAKYEALYGLNLLDLLRASLSRRTLPWLPQPCPMCFENDVVAFALGESQNGLGAGKERGLFITLGTGCGSTFLEGGHQVRGRYGLPDHGMLFDQPFGRGTVDDHLSRRGILGIARAQGIVGEVDVADLSAWADRGDERGLSVFREFGLVFAEALLPWIDRFRPQVVVLGGNIARAFRHFGSPLAKEVECLGCEVRVSDKMSESALIGVSNCLLQRLGDKPHFAVPNRAADR